MKKLILTIIIAAASNALLAQCKEDITIRTNPNNPANTELTPLIPSGGVNEQLNTFDWGKWRGTTNKTFDIIELNPSMGWLQNGQSIPANSSPAAWRMSSPYGFNMMTYYPYLLQSWNGSSHPQDKDWRWEDGWELMWLHTGYFPNGLADMNSINTNRIQSSSSTLANNSTPYIALYNRYTGKLRFFGNYKFDFGTFNPNSIQVRLAYTLSDFINVSGIFRHGNSYDQALDQKTRIAELSSFNIHPGSTNSWLVSDFQLAYDPCVCAYSSSFTREYKTVKSSAVILQSKTINFENKSIGILPNDFLNTITWKDNGKGSGNFTYKFMDKLNADYAESIETFEHILADYNKTHKQFARELINLSNELAKNGVINDISITEGAMNMVKEHMKNLGDFDENSEEELVKGIMKTADAIMSRDLDFISKQNVTQNTYTKPLKPTMPIASFSQTVTSGSIENSLTLLMGTVFTPGSFDPSIHNISSFNYPIYNKPTGLYALLKTPKLAFGNYVGAVREKNVVLGPNSNRLEGWTSKNFVAYAEFERITNRTEVHAKHVVSQDIVFKLNEQLLYKLNRNLDINDQKSHVLVSFQIELEGNLPRLFHDNNTVLNERRLEVDLSQSNFQILNHQPYINRNQKEKITLQIPWTKIDSTFKHLYGGRVNLIANYYVGTLVEKEFIRQAILPLVPSYRSNKSELLTNTDNLVTFNEDTKQIELLSKTDQLATTIKSIKMKVLTDLTFDQVSSKGGAINTTQVFTYLLYDKDNNIDLIQSNGTWLSNSETESLAKSVASPSLLTLSNEQINTSSPFISFISGNEIWIRAQEVHVEGTITVTPGYKAVFLLPEYSQGLKKLPGASLDSNIQVRLGDNFLRFSSNPITHEATREQVNTFCSVNNEYKAHLYDPNFIPDHDNTIIDNKDSIKKIKQHKPLLPNDASLFPNPNNGNFMVAFERVLDVDGELTLADFSGRIIQTEQLKKGTSRFQVDAHNLSSGIYFATISHKGQKSTHKVMVNRE